MCSKDHVICYTFTHTFTTLKWYYTLTKSSSRSSHFPIVKEHVPQTVDSGGKSQTTWFDGKPQFYI